ncbi:MAG: NAD-dependent epimerase/dehydratase family protein [Acidobacteriota bacterium]|jgi:UDP-glucose 4-epimerase|nr:NAD-dependent epimerase/dehydratase family protein [Acidobacteriota bacterium]
MKILVTGGAGFIGSNVVDRYIAEGHEVVIVDNLSTGRRENINPAAAFYHVDITDRKSLVGVLERERPQVVNHHAAQMDVRKSVEDPGFDAGINIIGSLNLIEAAVRNGVEKMIYISSGGAIYGDPEEIPATEECPVHPISHYGVSKYTVEKYLWLYNHNEGLRYTTLRYANVYGPRQRPDGEAGVTAIFSGLMLSGRRPTIFGAGDKTRDYVFVEDIVEANVLALDRGDQEAFNIGTGVQTSDQQVYDTVAEATGYPEPPIYGEERKGDVKHSALDWSKAKRVLGWEPRYTFAQGVAKTVEYNRGQLGL